MGLVICASHIILHSLLCYQRPQLVKGNMQLFSVDQQRSQALEAHAASYATFKVPLQLFLFVLVIFLFRFNTYEYCLIFSSRLLVMRTRQPLSVLPQKHLMLDRSLLSYMSSNWGPSQVCTCKVSNFLCALVFFFYIYI
jgi:hypothetical protein